MSDDNRYPMWLHHPNEQPAILSDDYEHGPRPPLGYTAQPGRPRIMPPVQVNNRDQELYYVSRGYLPGNSTMPAFVAAHQVSVERQVQQGTMPQAPALDPRLWPKWLHLPDGRSFLVKTPDEEAEVLARGSEKNEPQRQPIVPNVGDRPKPSRNSASMNERWEMVRRLKAMGVPADSKWKVDQLRAALAEHGQAA